MRALHGGRTREFQTEYHRGRNDAPEFDQGQPGRIDLARFFIEKMLVKDLTHRPLRIVELGCGAGDVTGPYSMGRRYEIPRGSIDTKGVEVIGVDFVPIAAIKCAERWPGMTFLLSPVEDLTPVDCDLLVMTEFLEHVADPLAITDAWMPHARWALIGHPIDEPDPPYEHGHSWSYSLEDWAQWFGRYNFHIWERVLFPMGSYNTMVMGHGSRR